MRFLSFHVEKFGYKVTKKGRSKIIEKIDDTNREKQVENALVLFTSMEASDEESPGILDRAVGEIEKITGQLKIKNIVLLPFAHLFGKLGSMDFAFASFKNLEAMLNSRDYTVIRIPFGWFNELDMKAKGHPLSRISRKIS